MRNSTRPSGLFICALLLLGIRDKPVSAINWPSPDAVMVENFGSNDEGKPLLGTVFEGEGPILAADAGEILFTHTEENGASRLPSPLGAWTALDHGDGVISIYSRFENSPESAVSGNVGQDQSIANAGQSGWSIRRGFYFSIFDRKGRRWVNPSMIITPRPDTEPPSIQSVELKNADGRSINPAQTRSLSQGRYTISVHAWDSQPETRGRTLAPYRILCSVNGLEIGALNFETYSARDGTLMMYRNGLVPVKQIYGPHPAFEVGEISFTRGQATLEVIAQDIAGNSRSVTFRLQIE